MRSNAGSSSRATRWSVVPVVVLVEAVLGAAACSSEGHHIGGQVEGMWSGTDGVALRLLADGVDTLLVVPRDGAFEFASDLAGGASYTVMVAGNPAKHTCAIDSGGNGIVGDSDVTTISVKCTGPMVLVGFPDHPSWVFDPSARSQTFDTSVFQDEVSLRLEGPSLLTASVNGQSVPLQRDIAPLPLESGENSVRLDLTADGGLSKRYELTFRRGPGMVDQRSYGKASTTAFGAHFGQTIAIDGDTLAVGAPAEGLGAVHVFVRSADRWTLQARIPSPSSPGFGLSIALSGDTLVVGAPGDNSSATGIGGDPADFGAPLSGAAHVFVRSGTAWMHQAYIKASNTNSADRFGAAVALSGETLAVGAPGEASRATGIGGDQGDNGAADAGAVYVFHRNGTRWQQEAYLKASNTDGGDQFGAAVAAAGTTVVVGSPGEASSARGINGDQADNRSVLAGAVYVFDRSPIGWTQQAYVKASNRSELFGASVALSTGASGVTLAVGSPSETGTNKGINSNQQLSGAPSGAVYVFVRAAGWAQQAYIKASNPGALDQFGASVAVSEDILAVGALGEAGRGGGQGDDSAPGAGAAYVFVRSADAWTQSAYAKAANVDPGDQFGASVAVSTEMFVGAPGEASNATGFDPLGRADNSAPGAGAIYIFR